MSSNRRLILACRMIAGTILAGCAAVATGVVSVRQYNNEVEYTKNAAEDAKRFKPHRCNDRLSDLLEVRSGTGHKYSYLASHAKGLACSQHSSLPCDAGDRVRGGQHA